MFESLIIFLLQRSSVQHYQIQSVVERDVHSGALDLKYVPSIVTQVSGFHNRYQTSTPVVLKVSGDQLLTQGNLLCIPLVLVSILLTHIPRSSQSQNITRQSH